MPKNGRVQAITRIIVTGILFLNAMLTAAGKNPIPLDESLIGEIVSYVASVIMIVWSWWRNNNMTINALKLQKWKEDMDQK